MKRLLCKIIGHRWVHSFGWFGHRAFLQCQRCEKRQFIDEEYRP